MNLTPLDQITLGGHNKNELTCVLLSAVARGKQYTAI